MLLVLDGERIDVGTQRDGAVGVGRTHVADHTRAAGKNRRVEPGGRQPFADQRRGPNLASPQLGVGMEVAAELDEPLVHLGGHLGHHLDHRGGQSIDRSSRGARWSGGVLWVRGHL